jgi:UDP-3-O-[3-hydroxymyristoyl] glucosamine N-acyltransferase
LKTDNQNSSTSDGTTKRKRNIGEIARYLGGEVVGDAAVEVAGIASIEEAKPGDLTFLANPKYRAFLNTTSASAIIVGPDDDVSKCQKPLIKHKNPYLAFARALELFFGSHYDFPADIHPTAILGKDVLVEEGVHIGPHVVVENGTKLRQGSTILAGCFVGADSEIGEKSLIYPNVTIRENVKIGKKVIIHSGAVIGSDGFGFARDGIRYHKIPQVGGVEIGDDVEIGANVTVDRATLGVTRIGKGTKIDNLVQIAHNVNIGENCIIAGQVGISGSTQIGDGSVIAGQVGMAGHIKIGKGVIVGAQSGVTKDVPDGTTVFGYPAREIHKTKRIEAHLSRLDLYVERLKEVEQALKKIQKNSR